MVILVTEWQRVRSVAAAGGGGVFYETGFCEAQAISELLTLCPTLLCAETTPNNTREWAWEWGNAGQDRIVNRHQEALASSGS